MARQSFKSLAEGSTFIFASEIDYPFSGAMRGPWIKVGPRRYVLAHPVPPTRYRLGHGMTEGRRGKPKLIVYRVGSSNVSVIPTDLEGRPL